MTLAGSDGLAFVHRVRAPSQTPARGVLYLFHGTGGDASSLLELGGVVAPDHLLVGVRGRSDEEGATRFFRRFDALHYDQAHLAAEAGALAAFVRAAAERYGAGDLPRAALGYSNGANVALAAELLDPGSFERLALLRPVQPFEQPPMPELDGLSALLLLGRHDPYLAAGRDLPDFLVQRGAAVQHAVLGAGHALTQEDVTSLAGWFSAGPA